MSTLNRSPDLNRRMLNTAIFAAATCCASLLSGCGDTVSDRDIEFATLAEVRSWVQDKPGTAKLIDPRAPEEFAAGHLPGAQNLQLPAVSDRKDSIDPALARYKVLVVYGNDPGSAIARAMTKRLMRAGAGDVKLFGGGVVEWTRAGLPIEKSPLPVPSGSAPTK